MGITLTLLKITVVPKQHELSKQHGIKSHSYEAFYKWLIKVCIYTHTIKILENFP